jgi:hypothetical protein
MLLQSLAMRLASTLIFACLLTMGCGGGIRGLHIKGKVVKNGQMLDLHGDILMIYVVSKNEGMRYRSLAIYRPADGTFECDGPTRQGFPEGKIRIELWPGKADLPPYIDTLFHNEFKGEKSPLEVTLTESNALNLIVDVGTKTVR